MEIRINTLVGRAVDKRNTNAMRKWFLTLVALLVVAAVCGLALWTSSPPEPVWKGKKLSAWITDFVGFDPALESATMEAVRGMGTNHNTVRTGRTASPGSSIEAEAH
jgi:hypothetical protein